MLWCLRRRASDVLCILYPDGLPVEVRIVQGLDVVLTELFQEEWLALNWARAYENRLREQGWHDASDKAAGSPPGENGGPHPTGS